MTIKKHYMVNSNLSFPLAVALSMDDYDFVPDGTSMSVTDTLKPIRELQLRKEIKEVFIDVAENPSSFIGRCIHAWFDAAWDDPEAIKIAAQVVGIPEGMIAPDKFKVCKSIDEALLADKNGMYYALREQRITREFLGYNLSGKFDLVLNGEVSDLKTMSQYSYEKHDLEKFIWQMSIYRWLNPELITKDTCAVHYIITNFSKQQYGAPDPKAPPSWCFSCKYPLKSLEETEQYLTEVIQKMEGEEAFCTPEEMWLADSVFKIYKDLNNQSRSLKNSSTFTEAAEYAAKKGIPEANIVEVKGTPRRCEYCSVKDICNQYASFGDTI